MRVTIRGLQEAQRAMLKTIAAVKPAGGLGRAVQYLAVEAHRYLVGITHVDTGAYRASQFITRLGLERYMIHINPSAKNPYGARPAIYGVVEEARGGEHAAYQRTFQQGLNLIGQAARYLISELP